MEAFLPSWDELLRALLSRVAADEPRLRTKDERQEWIDRTIKRDDLLGAAAVVEVLSGEQLHTILPDVLYRGEGPEAYEPGPIALEVARLRTIFGERLTLLTTNYDDLLERALQAIGIPKARIKTYVRRRANPPADAVPVTHLHGYAGRDKAPSQLVLSEEQYTRMQRGTSWQEQLVTERLQESTCVFVGTSLNDPNLIRYLYGYKKSTARSHAAIFVRQGEVADLSQAVRVVREDAVRRRWERCGVEAIFVDHYADAAQLMYEIGYRRKAGDAYTPVGQRAAHWLTRVRRDVLALEDPEAFRLRQVALSRIMRLTLEEALRQILGDVPLGDERLAVALWLLDQQGQNLVGWAHSDRAHQDPKTVAGVPVGGASEWVAVRALCQGVIIERDRKVYASRWRFVRGIPFTLQDPTRLPVGCVTISSTKPRTASVIAALGPDDLAVLHGALVRTAERTIALLLERTGESS